MSEEQLGTGELRRALEEDWIVLFLQPKFNITNDTICGAEVLIRMQHPEQGVILPEKFLPQFEEKNLMKRLDRYVLQKTCGMLKEWSMSGKIPYPVAVNISKSSLMDIELAAYVKKLLDENDIAPEFLQIELTEKSYMLAPAEVEAVVYKLHELGLNVIMDDYGSGSFSMNTLRRLPMDALKLDMKYFPIKEKTENDEIILASIVKMANWMGISVIAEGVENRRQKDFLQGTGCDCIQGYFFSEVLSRKAYEEIYIYSDFQKSQHCEQIELKGPKHNLTVLVIDDDEMSRAILQEIFQEYYFVHTCESAEEGLAYLTDNKNKVRLILVDKFMPGMSGIEFLRYCKQDESLSVIPQIMITADEQESSQLDAFRVGAYDYITKPFTREIVTARVNHIMELSCRTSIFDIIEQKYKQKPELDAATELLNKMAFRDLSVRTMEILYKERLALLVIDIDDFKKVNDKYGHLMGDKIIRCVADELTNAFRKTDLVGRFGGDEFVVLVPKIQSRETAKLKAMEIIKTVLFSCVKHYNINISISIGLAFSEGGETFDKLFERADKALYEAKESGKGKVMVYGEKIPKIVLGEDKPIVLIYSQNEQVYSTVALTYGVGAGFAQIRNHDELLTAFEQYGKRICVVCVDMQEKIMDISEFAYQYLMQQNERRRLPILAICPEGDMQRLKCALQLKTHDIIMFPPQIGVIERILSRTIMEAGKRDYSACSGMD